MAKATYSSQSIRCRNPLSNWQERKFVDTKTPADAGVFTFYLFVLNASYQYHVACVVIVHVIDSLMVVLLVLFSH